MPRAYVPTGRPPGRPRAPSPYLVVRAPAAPPTSAVRVWCRDCGCEIVPGAPGHRAHDTEPFARSRGTGDLGAGVVRIGTSAGGGVERIATGFVAFDRLVGDDRNGRRAPGLVANGYYLLAGEPGAGKSTLMLQLAAGLAFDGETVLLVAGEEARDQIDERARRLGVAQIPGLYLLETDRWGELDAAVRFHAGGELDPSVVILDSAQRLRVLDYAGAPGPGSNTQIEAVAERGQILAKRTNRLVLVVSQVNGDGDVKGPMSLEHAVDCVLKYTKDGDGRRVLAVTKNRFGPADNALVLEMTATGLREAREALPEPLRAKEPEPGVVAFPAVLGAGASQALVVAVEASVDLVPEDGGKVVEASGYPAKELRRLVDALARETSFALARRSIRVAVPTVGGRTIGDPGLDLAVAAAVLSAAAGRPAPPAFGRVALSGRVDGVAQTAVRLAALRDARLGRPLASAAVREGRPVTHLSDLLEILGPAVFVEAASSPGRDSPPALLPDHPSRSGTEGGRVGGNAATGAIDPG